MDARDSDASWETARLARQIDALQRTRSYAVFAAFIREGAVRRWVSSALGLTDADVAAALVDLDNRQATFLPETIDDLAPRTARKLRAIFEFVKVQLRKKSPQTLLAAICGAGQSEAHVRATGDVACLDVDRGSPCAAAADLPKAWKLHLPVPPPFRAMEKISPTRLDGYARCPFTAFLNDKEVLGSRRVEGHLTELPRWECGNLVHAALEAFGLSDVKDAASPAAIRAFLEAQVDDLLTARFGASVPQAVQAQGMDIKRRLANFAVRQAVRRAEGWRIVAVERRLEQPFSFVRPDGTTGHVRVYGKCDRIDVNETTGAWRIVDYKMWDTAASLSADRRRDGRPHEGGFQLPLYCALLDAAEDEALAAATRDRISAGYCILGQTADDVLFADSQVDGTRLSDVEAAARRLFVRFERGIFWPPSPARAWRRDFGDWLAPAPEATVDEDWITDQEARLKAAEEEGA